MNVKKEKALPALYDLPWAIAGDGFETISRVVEKAGAVEAILARPGIQMSDAPGVAVRGRVAVVEMIGPVMHYAGGLMSWLFGFPSAEGMLADIQAAQDNPAVDAIVLSIDSPGGQVGGIAELSNHIKNKITKPVVAYVGDMAASAAYWVASAADSIIAAPTAEIGSIGVVFTMRRKQDNTIEVVSSVSPKKRVDPETDEGRQAIQARADALADVFVSQVAENRTLSADQVTGIGGDVVIASAAIDIGLIDDIGSLEQVISDLNDNKQIKGMKIMNLEKLKADYPDLHAQVMDAGRAEVQAKMDAALETAKKETTAAVDTVKAGTLDMVAVVLGDDARTKLDQVMASGMTAEQVKIGKELFGAPGDTGDAADNADATTRKKILDGIRDGAPDPAPPSGDDKKGEDFMDKVDAYQAAHNCKRSVALGAIAASDPDLHESWLKDQQK
jgi:signal peptide peptidase SppA